MSWNWTEELEKKEYETKGTVTISTEEYRDLIAMNYELQHRGQKEHDDWYKEYNERRDFENKYRELNKKWSLFQDFLSDHLTVKEDWENYMNKKRLEELDNE